MDFPDYKNIGDSAIFCGTWRFLQGRAIKVRHLSSAQTFDLPSLRRLASNGSVIVQQGGGNFGDLYSRHQRIRTEILNALPDAKYIQLPQSLHFEHEDALDRFRALAQRASDYHIMTRDNRSLALAATLSHTSSIAPDMAHLLRLHHRASPPETDVLVLRRRDGEARGAETVRGTSAFDWPSSEPGLSFRMHRLGRRLHRLHSGAEAKLALHTYPSLAERRLQRGIDLLSRGRVIVTDRLHAVILGRAIGRRVVFVDNSYGKLGAYVSAWLPADEKIRAAVDFADAEAVARRIVASQS
ncbi:MAG: polysaccharide pyruvyl transferase family protein [Motilibacteraceae bacterium]